jgi:class 3 adenylate cyclase
MATTRSPQLDPGDVLGSYEVEEELGRGALGVVYRARHIHLGRTVALKVLHPHWTASPEFVERFREEGRLLALLEHPNILRVYDAGECDGIFYLATRLIQGRTLEQLLGPPVPPAAAILLARQVAAALAFAHANNVVHRDVKPANIMVGARGEVTLTDFGVARLRDAPSLTMPGVQVGTPFYMAPEQILGRRADARSDLYALGVVLHQMLSGAPPYPGQDTETVFHGHIHQPPPPLPDSCPEWLRRVVRKALEKDPAARFASAEVMMQALDSGGNEAVLLAAGVGAPGSAPGTSQTPEHARGGAPTRLTRREHTVLSLDVVGSRAMKLPGETLGVLHRFALFRDYVRAHLQAHGEQGTVWSGDGLLALFPSPAAGVACARAILAGLPRFNEETGGQPIRVRVGLHAGHLLMAPDQPLGEVTSSVIDTAHKLQELAPPDGALVAEIVAAGTPEHGLWAPVGPEVAAAFSFTVYRLASLAPTAAGAAPSPPAAPVHGEPLAVRPSAAAPAGTAGPAASYPLRAAGPSRLRLQAMTGNEITGGRVLEIAEEAVLGRPDPAASGNRPGATPRLQLPGDDAISRRHLRFYRSSSGYRVEDLDSANGTRLNGEWLEPYQSAPLRPGDRLDLGESTVLTVLPPEEEPPGPS